MKAPQAMVAVRLRFRELSPVFSGAATLTMGTAVGAVALALSSPVVSRLYGPAALGALAVYVSILAMVAQVGSLSYEIAIPIERDDTVAANLLIVALAIAVTTSAVIATVVIWMPDLVLGPLRAPALKHYLPLLPIAFSCTAVFQILNSWAIRGQAFRQIASTRVSQILGNISVQLSVGIVNHSPWGLFAGDLVGRGGGTVVLLRNLFNTCPQGVMSLAAAYKGARRYWRFPVLTTGASVLTLAGSQLPVLLLSRYFGLEVAGCYALTSRVLATPNSLMGQALGQAFLGRAAGLRDKHRELRSLTENTAGWIFVIGLPLFAIVGLDGPALFAVVFGDRWAVAGVYAQRLSPLFCLWLAATPLNHLLTIREWQGSTLGFAFLNCLTTLVSLYAGVRLNSPVVGITVLGTSWFLLTAANLARMFRAGHSSWSRILRRIAPVVGCIAIAIAAAAFAIRGFELWAIAMRSAGFLLLYTLLVTKFKLYPSPSWGAGDLLQADREHALCK